MTADDESGRWLDAVRGGKREALEQLLVEHLATLRAFVRLQVGAEVRRWEGESDFVQSVCREILEKQVERFEYRGEAAFRSWLYGAVLHKVRDRARYHRAEKRAAARRVDAEQQLSGAYASVCTPSKIVAAREQVERVEAAFERLPEHYARVLTLSRLVGLSHGEIAVELDTSENNVSQLLKRATLRLSRELASDSDPAM